MMVQSHIRLVGPVVLMAVHKYPDSVDSIDVRFPDPVVHTGLEAGQTLHYIGPSDTCRTLL